MIDGVNKYISIKKDVQEHTNSFMTKEELDSFDQHIESKLLNFTPTIMIYGTYNSGKSSLLNALFGKEEIAKTGDAPETKEVCRYVYDGYTIFDTPGLNANSEDDAVTKDHFEKSEIIIFVISSDGSFEEDYIYNKISEVVKAKKPIIIVMNNKNGIDPDSIVAKQIMNKLGENLIKIGDRNDIDKIETKVNLCMVNAKSALKAKIENKNILLLKSNILQLEKMIKDVLEKSDTKEVINTLDNYIRNFIESSISRIDNKIDNVNAQKIEELITYLEKLRLSSELKAKNIISKKMPIMADALTSMFQSESASQNLLDSYMSENMSVINDEMTNFAKNIESTLNTKIENFSFEFNEIDVEHQTIDIPSESKDYESDSFLSKESKQKYGSLLKDKKVIEIATSEALKKAKLWLPKNIMFGKGPVWINKFASKAAIGVSIAIEAYSLYSANKEHQQMIEEKRSRTIGARNSADSIVSGLQADINNYIDKMIAEIFNDLIIKFKGESKSLSSDNFALIENKTKLHTALNRL